jgi:hypothetical protein
MQCLYAGKQIPKFILLTRSIIVSNHWVSLIAHQRYDRSQPLAGETHALVASHVAVPTVVASQAHASAHHVEDAVVGPQPFHPQRATVHINSPNVLDKIAIAGLHAS